MYLGQEFPVLGNWFYIHFTENPGMAFGMELGGEYGKLILTTFRLGEMIGICWYLVHLAQRNAHSGLLWSIAAVLGGAIGNVIDSTFYGVWLDNAPFEAITPPFLPSISRPTPLTDISESAVLNSPLALL